MQQNNLLYILYTQKYENSSTNKVDRNKNSVSTAAKLLNTQNSTPDIRTSLALNCLSLYNIYQN